MNLYIYLAYFPPDILAVDIFICRQQACIYQLM